MRHWLKSLHRELTEGGTNYDTAERTMRQRIREALCEPDFRRMVGEPGSEPSRFQEPGEAGTLSDADRTSFPHPGSFAILLR